MGAALPAQYVPGSQTAHTGGELDVAGSVCTVPAAHAPLGKHVDWFGEPEYVPSTHAAHCRSAIAVPTSLTWLPGAQVVHGVQLGAFASTLNVPLAHVVHCRSAVALPAALIDCPGAQLVHGTHAVAELPSWSQVPAEQSSLGAAPPAQYVPASHALQTAGDVDVAAAICTVPAEHAVAGTHADWLSVDVNVPSAHAAHWRSAIVVPAP